MVENSVLLVGSGIVGRAAANYLTYYRGVEGLTVVDKDGERAHLAAINAEICAHYLGNYPRVEDRALDVDDEDAVVKLLKEASPKVILNATTMLPSWFYIPLIKKRMKEIEMKDYYPGHTLAKDLLLIYKLMKAVKKTSLNAKVVSVSFPDNTHPVLAKAGLSPTVGAGHVDITAMGVRKVVADKLRVPAHNISVTMIGHHALNWVDPAKVPYYMKIRMGETDLTKKLDPRALILEAIDLMVRDYDEQMAAVSAVREAVSILENRGEILLGSGVNGIPGCVPARLDRRGAEVVLPEDITMNEVLRMNQTGMRLDGIEKVKEDGTVIFTEPTVKLLKKALGLEWDSMKLTEVEEMTQDLIKAYNKLKNRYS